MKPDNFMSSTKYEVIFIDVSYGVLYFFRGCPKRKYHCIYIHCGSIDALVQLSPNPLSFKERGRRG